MNGIKAFDALQQELGTPFPAIQQARKNAIEKIAELDDPRFQRVRELGHTFQQALNDLFLPEDAQTGYYHLTRTYGVF